MKSLLTTTLLACTIAASATGYKSEFYNFLEKEDFTRADSVLSLWKSNVNEDPEVQIARFNLLLNQSRLHMIQIGQVDATGDDYFVLTDSLGHQAGTISKSVTWNDGLYNKAIGVINLAIDQWPDRLDMRWGLAKAQSMRHNWNNVTNTVIKTLDRSVENKFDWKWDDNIALGDSARQIVNNGSFDYLREIIFDDEDNTALTDTLANHIIKLFPTDYRVLNVLGLLRFQEQNFDKALEYFLKADECYKDDGLINCNIARLYLAMGDEKKALELYKEIESNDRYDEESRENARTMIADINKEYDVIREYDYFFRYLPTIGQYTTIEEGEETLSSPGTVNTQIAEFNKFKSPFADNDISITTYTMNNMKVYVWTFPDPTESPLCKYIAFIPDSNSYTIYTLERSYNGYWVLGTQKESTHSNFGAIEYPATAEGFFNSLQRVVFTD